MKPDFNSEEADIYIRSVRAMEKAGVGHRIFSRPALNAYESEQAKVVRTRVDRSLFPLDKKPGDRVYFDQTLCPKCGQPLTETCRLWRQVFPASGGHTDIYVCATC